MDLDAWQVPLVIVERDGGARQHGTLPVACLLPEADVAVPFPGHIHADGQRVELRLGGVQLALLVADGGVPVVEDDARLALL